MGATGPIHNAVGWRVAFYIYGSLVVVWAAFWVGFFVNKPHESGFCCRIGTRELATILHFRGSPSQRHQSSKGSKREKLRDGNKADEAHSKNSEKGHKEKESPSEDSSGEGEAKVEVTHESKSSISTESYSELVREAQELEGGPSVTESKSELSVSMSDGKGSKKKHKKRKEKIPWLAIFSSKSYISVCVALFARTNPIPNISLSPLI